MSPALYRHLRKAVGMIASMAIASLATAAGQAGSATGRAGSAASQASSSSNLPCDNKADPKCASGGGDAPVVNMWGDQLKLDSKRLNKEVHQPC